MPPKPDRQLAEWIELWQLGELDDAGRDALVARLEADAESRKVFYEAVKFEALLHTEFPDSVIHVPRVSRPWYRQASGALALAASIALVAAVVHLVRKPGSEVIGSAGEIPGEAPFSSAMKIVDASPVARVNVAREIQLDASSMTATPGSLLRPGRLHLLSGEMELTFFSGARVTLKGPCIFQLKSDFRATLIKGQLTADVPQQAIGFTVHTPTGQLRDLGTSFAVNVASNGVSDVHVLEGEVEASSVDGSKVVTLGVNEASRLTGGTLEPIDFTPSGWPSKPTIEWDDELPDGVHWSLDEFEGDKTSDSHGVHPLYLRGESRESTDWTSRACRGVSGSGLNFSGDGEYAESTYRGVSGSRPRTVSLWVSIPPDASAEYPNGILSWGAYTQAKKWQVCWNNGNQGTVGALRVEFGNGHLIGTTDLRDGRFHHIAVVFLGGEHSDVASHVKLYVDGRLETLSGRLSQFIRTDTQSNQAVAVTLGRWLGRWPGKGPFSFRGAIDEVYIFDKALHPAQVAKLAQWNRE
ncbi:MAG: FecR domain-containing protein [Akkermansiaceae bacterium]|nr:FecR domain-containing protein [Akkermansiaceae bacterium]